ncbi:MAG: hypothetical protein QG639_1098 [Patescibacteria group bacterium]|nr:hypothetical protein [Patescibacteria group bacterium]
MNVLLDTSPLKTGHSHRGIGLYTSMLFKYLKQIPDLHIFETRDQAKNAAIDVVHYPYFDLFFHTLPILKPAKKSVVTIHDVIPLEFKEQYRAGKKGTVAFYSQRLALSNVSTILTDSLSSKKSISEKLQVSERKIRPIYLAGNPSLKAQDEETVNKVREKYQLPKTYILYVGDINYNKNIPQLIKSLKFLNENVHLVLFGKNFHPQDIPEWQWIETQIALSDVAARVHFITELDGIVDTELSALYSGAAVYVQPSLAEGFGLPVLEALQCKTLVVSSNKTSLPEVGGGSVAYCEPIAEALADAVEGELALSPSERALKIAEGYTWSQSFSWKRTAQETYEVYKSLVAV